MVIPLLLGLAAPAPRPITLQDDVRAKQFINRIFAVARTLPSEIREAKRAGLPVNSTDVKPAHNASGQDSAGILHEIAQLLARRPLTEEDGRAEQRLSWRYNASEVDIAAFRTALARQADFTTLVHKLALCKNVPVGKSALSAPFASNESLYAEWLSAESRLQFHDGHGEKAAHTAGSIFGVARQPAAMRRITQYFVARGIDTIGVVDLREMAVRSGGNPRTLTAIVAELAADPVISIALAITGEWLSMRSTIERSREVNDVTSGFQASFDAVLLRAVNQQEHTSAVEWKRFANAVVDALEAESLREDREAYLIARLPYPQASKRAVEFQKEFSKSDPAAILASSAAELLPDLVERQASAIGMARVARAGVAVLLYHSVHRRSPGTLAEAMKAPPTDPFTDKPLLYSSTATGFAVWSAGSKWNPRSPALPNLPYRRLVFRYPLRPGD